MAIQQVQRVKKTTCGLFQLMDDPAPEIYELCWNVTTRLTDLRAHSF